MIAITGAGKYYSSGNDLAVFAESLLGGTMTPTEMADNAYSIMVPFVDAFIEFPKPLAAMINGKVVKNGGYAEIFKFWRLSPNFIISIFIKFYNFKFYNSSFQIL